jgi:hypothetical protein
MLPTSFTILIGIERTSVIFVLTGAVGVDISGKTHSWWDECPLPGDRPGLSGL